MDSGVAQSTSSQPSQQQPSSDTVNEAVVPVLHSIAENKSTDAASAKYSLVCDKRKDILDKDPTVKFMLQKLEEVRIPLHQHKATHGAKSIYYSLVGYRLDASSQRIG